MKRIITCILMLTVQLINAQDRDLKKANIYFERTFYDDAIPLYEKNTNTPFSFEAMSRLADAYYYTQDLKNALKWYSILIKDFEPNLQEGHYYRYAHTLKALDQYDEGNAILRKQLAKKSTKTLNQFDKDVQLLKNIKTIGNQYILKNLEINTNYSDFGAIEHRDHLIFTTNKKSKYSINKIDKWNRKTLFDLYTIPIDQLNSRKKHIEPFFKKNNTKLHESNAVITKDGMTIYFTRNSPKYIKDKKIKVKISYLQIYKAELIDGQWGNILLLPFNIEGYSSEHPALSNDERTLYFSSNRPGTLGSFDLFSVTLHSDGTFGKPENLGNTINTKGDEQYPFVSKDNKLYFSSDGHLGFGGLDIFVSDLKNGSFSKPVNVGLPVNSGYDDFSFNIDSDTKTGYFASNRPGGKGSDDIYSLEKIKPLITKNHEPFVVKTSKDDEPFVVKTSKDHEPFVVKTSKDHEPFVVKTSKDHQPFVVKTSKDHEPFVVKTSKDHQPFVVKTSKDHQPFVVKTSKDHQPFVVKTSIDGTIYTKTIYFDFNLSYIRKDAKTILDKAVKIMKKHPNMVIEVNSHTDSRGTYKYNMTLSKKRALETKSYLISKGIKPEKILAKGYGKTTPIVQCEPLESCTEEQHELNRRSEFVIKNL